MKMSNPKGIEKLKELEIKLEKTELTREIATGKLKKLEKSEKITQVTNKLRIKLLAKLLKYWINTRICLMLLEMLLNLW